MEDPTKRKKVNITLTKSQRGAGLYWALAFHVSFWQTHLAAFCLFFGHLNKAKLKSNGLNCLVEAISR